MAIYHVKVTESVKHVAHYYLDADSGDEAAKFVESGEIDIHHIEISDYTDALETHVAEVNGERKSAADKALADFDFEPDRVSESGAWDTESGDEWTCILSMDGEDGPHQRGFIVRSSEYHRTSSERLTV
jgi:hypothetical protein